MRCAANGRACQCVVGSIHWLDCAATAQEAAENAEKHARTPNNEAVYQRGEAAREALQTSR